MTKSFNSLPPPPPPQPKFRAREGLRPAAEQESSITLTAYELATLRSAIDLIQALLQKTSYHSASCADSAVARNEAVQRQPAVAIADSVGDDYIICLEDGVSVKSLTHYLRRFGLTPQTYRDKWGLPADYPMVTRALREKRSAVAMQVRPHLRRKFAQRLELGA